MAFCCFRVMVYVCVLMVMIMRWIYCDISAGWQCLREDWYVNFVHSFMLRA